MSAERNPFSSGATAVGTTAAAAQFIEEVNFAAIPAEAVRIATRCLLDGLGLFVAGSEEHTVQLLVEEAEEIGGRPDALLLSRGKVKIPAPEPNGAELSSRQTPAPC